MVVVVVLPLVEGGGDELLVLLDFILHSAGVVAVGMDGYLAQRNSFLEPYDCRRVKTFIDFIRYRDARFLACQNWGRFLHLSAEQFRIPTTRFT